MRHLDGKGNISTEDIWPGNTNSGKTKEIQKTHLVKLSFPWFHSNHSAHLLNNEKILMIELFLYALKLKLGKLKKSIESWYYDVMMSFFTHLHWTTKGSLDQFGRNGLSLKSHLVSKISDLLNDNKIVFLWTKISIQKALIYWINWWGQYCNKYWWIEIDENLQDYIFIWLLRPISATHPFNCSPLFSSWRHFWGRWPSGAAQCQGLPAIIYYYTFIWN